MGKMSSIIRQYKNGSPDVYYEIDILILVIQTILCDFTFISRKNFFDNLFLWRLDVLWIGKMIEESYG